MAAAILDVVRLYGLAGVAVAAAFLGWGVGRVQPKARGAWAFRPLIAPGVVLLWPLVLWRWRALARGVDRPGPESPPRRAQDTVAFGLALAIPAVLAVGLLVRQDGPAEREAVLLEPPAARP